MYKSIVSICLLFLLFAGWPIATTATTQPAEPIDVDPVLTHLKTMAHTVSTARGVRAWTSHSPVHATAERAPFTFIADPDNPSAHIRDWVLGIIFVASHGEPTPCLFIDGRRVAWDEEKVLEGVPIISPGFFSIENGAYKIDLRQEIVLLPGQYQAVFCKMDPRIPEQPEYGVTTNSEIRFMWTFDVKANGESLNSLKPPSPTPVPQTVWMGVPRRF